MGEHGISLHQDDEGWDYATCSCGWVGPPCPGADIAADFYADHANPGETPRAASISFDAPEESDG